MPKSNENKQGKELRSLNEGRSGLYFSVEEWMHWCSEYEADEGVKEMESEMFLFISHFGVDMARNVCSMGTQTCGHSCCELQGRSTWLLLIKCKLKRMQSGPSN